MAKKSGSYIKRAVNKVIDLKGSDRNAVKNLKQFVKQDQYKHLGEKLVGKNTKTEFKIGDNKRNETEIELPEGKWDVYIDVENFLPYMEFYTFL